MLAIEHFVMLFKSVNIIITVELMFSKEQICHQNVLNLSTKYKSFTSQTAGTELYFPQWESIGSHCGCVLCNSGMNFCSKFTFTGF